MYAEVSSGAVRETGEKQGCKYTGANEQKGHEKMTKKRSPEFSGKKHRMIEIKCIHV